MKVIRRDSLKSPTILKQKKKKVEANSATQASKIKCVSFKSTVTLHKVLHINDFTTNEIDSTWYDVDEILHFKRECVRTIAMMMLQQKPIDTNEYFSRGLEHKTPTAFHNRQKRKHAAVDAVLTKQDNYRILNDNDNGIQSTSTDSEESIALVYMQYSIPSQMAAHVQGLIDQQRSQSSCFSCTANLAPNIPKRSSFHELDISCSAFRMGSRGTTHHHRRHRHTNPL